VDVGVLPKSTRLALRNLVLAAYNAASTPEVKYGLAVATVMVICLLANKGRSQVKPDEVGELLNKHPNWDRRLLEALAEARKKNVR
jgi:hypothetical protein